MDQTQFKTAKEFLSFLGLTDDEIKIYLTLAERGPLPILPLSRLTGINRTKIYRMLDELKKKGVVEEIIDEHRMLTKASGIDTLELLIKNEESKTRFLREVFPAIAPLLSGQMSVSQPGTKVLFFRGKEGVRQQIWNTLRTKGEAIGYTYRPVAELIGEYYYDWRNEWIKRKLFFRDIINPDYLIYKKEITDKLIYPDKFFATRIIQPEILCINHQIDIYNEVVSYYNWHEGEVFGVEIYNEKIASMQRQLFEMVWKMAEKK